jgi:hypothetical protein
MKRTPTTQCSRGPQEVASLAPDTGDDDTGIAMPLSHNSPAVDRHLLAELLDQQMWFFGRDIQHPDGNLLLRFGFDRSRPPVAVSGTSRYIIATHAGVLVLWGWGAVWRDADPLALLMRRHGPGPRLISARSPLDDVWAHTALAGTPARSDADRARLDALLTDFAGWVSEYEQWARATCGEPWRQECAALRPRHVQRKQVIAADRYVQSWQQLAATGLAA